MISINMEFGSDHLERIVAGFTSLPDALRPTHFGDDETNKGSRKPIDDAKAFASFFDNRTTGFFLFCPRSEYLVTFANGKPIHVYGSTQEQLSARPILMHMAKADPIFGCACLQQERQRWNRLDVEQGMNTIESWVGRDPRKYVPGLYWWTLLPTTLAKKHQVSLTVLATVAREHIEIGGNQNLFRFYERPEDWPLEPAVDFVRRSQPGIFDVERVRPLAEAAKNFTKLSEVTRAWP